MHIKSNHFFKICFIAVMIVAAVFVSAGSVFAASEDCDHAGFIVMGDDVNGTAGFQNNIVYLTDDELEALKDNKDPGTYGLGDCWVSGRVYSSYDNHGTGGYHYILADGLDIKGILDEIVRGGSEGTDSFWIYSSDGYSTKVVMKTLSDLYYFAPGDSQGVPSEDPMIALYKVSTKTDDPEKGIVPDGPTLRLESGEETFVFGQNDPTDNNNCHFIKSVNTLIVGDFRSFVQSRSDRYTAASLKNIIEWGIYEKDFVISDGAGTSRTHKVRGVPLSMFIDKMGLSKYMPDHADVAVQAEAENGDTVTIDLKDIDGSFIAWDYADDSKTPAEQTGCFAFYMQNGDGAGNVLYNLSNINVVYKNGDVVTSVPQKPVTPPAAVKNAKASRASYNSIKLTWSKSSDADGYEICRATSKSGKYTVIKTTTASSYTNGSLKTGTTYYYKVRAFKNSDNGKVYSSYSSIVSSKPYLTKPSARLTAGKKQITVKWNKISGASGYKIYRSTKKSSGYKCIKTVKSSSTVKYTNKSLKKGRTYYYKVKAYRKTGSSVVYSSYSTVKYMRAK